MKKRVLFVDDEASVLDGLQRLLRQKRNEWEMAFAPGGREALGLMKEKPFDVIVSDMRMPEMSGAELLTTVMNEYPKTVRFALSGQTDREMFFQSLSSSHQFLSKPCEAECLINTIERAFSLRELLLSANLTRLVTQLRVIPSLPKLYVDVVSELRSPNASVQRVGEIIAQDMAMSVKVLQLINSAFFGLHYHVSSPTQAASLLGLDILKSLVLVVHVFGSAKNVHLPAGLVEHLWAHSLVVGRGAQALARKMDLDKRSVDDAFIAGLFHDLGRLLLILNLPEQYAQAIKGFQEKYVLLTDAETAVFGATHAEIGGYLLGLWGFSDPVVEAAAFHHRPSECIGNHTGILAAVHVASASDNIWGELSATRPYAELDKKYLEKAGFAAPLDDWMTLCRQVSAQGYKKNG
ncbi:MAG: hypothetical protein A2X46_11615 [Lentisphaerae bacterium GWF2_57_35]|nr:MAG: hypothetical protein A2X46_11615 [Lentisphaerae bacterium GWF2_57_35]